MRIYCSQHLLSFLTSFLTCVRPIKLNTLHIQPLKIETAVPLYLSSLLRPRDKILFGNITLCLRDDWGSMSVLSVRPEGVLPSHLSCETQLC